MSFLAKWVQQTKTHCIGKVLQDLDSLKEFMWDFIPHRAGHNYTLWTLALAPKILYVTAISPLRVS